MALPRLIEDSFNDTKEQGCVLRHLNSFSLQWTEFDIKTIDLLASLATLPSLRSIRARSVSTVDNTVDFVLLEPKTSNVENLSLRRSAFNPAALDFLLSRVGALKSSAYTWPYYTPQGWESLPGIAAFNPAGLSAILADRTKDSLISLRIRSFEDKSAAPVFIQTLQECQRLEYLETSISLFGHIRSSTSTTLALELPPTIETIVLRDFYMMDVHIFNKIVTELVTTKGHLSRLSVLALHIVVGLDEDLEALRALDTSRRSCEHAGIRLNVLHEIGDPDFVN